MPKDGTQTREKILDTAQALIYQRGFTATTLDRVLDGAGLTKGAFFHHFKNKDDLALALVGGFWALNAVDAAIQGPNITRRAIALQADPAGDGVQLVFSKRF